ncbi:hypothetical protein BT93_C1309 [Corymbia citriodora subsp. variegata]|nr:hypothetical protein BT93_C1309 [Corymbia citriodora subsp. variegata]
MGTVHCGYGLKLTRSFGLPGLPTGIFNFSVRWHHLLVFVDQLGMTTNFQHAILSELSLSIEMPLCILGWQSLFEAHMQRVLYALGVHPSFWPEIIGLILHMALWGSRHGHRPFDMSINLELVLKEEVEEESIKDISFGGYESDADQVTQGVSRSTIEKLEEKSCSAWDGDGHCCICLEKLDGIEKVMEIPCSHFFHSRCIIHWLERNNSCPLCRCKVEEVDP